MGSQQPTVAVTQLLEKNELMSPGLTGFLVCRAVFVVLQTFRLGNSSDQVRYERQECEGWRQQRIRVKKLYCQVQSSISEIKSVLILFPFLLLH